MTNSKRESGRQATEKRLQKQLQEWRVQRETMAKRAAEASAKAREELDARLRHVRLQDIEAARQLDYLMQAGVDSWDETRMQAEKAYSRLGDALRDVRSRLNELDL